MKTSEAINPVNQQWIIQAAGNAYDNHAEYDGQGIALYARYNEVLGIAESITCDQVEFEAHHLESSPSKFQSGPFEYVGKVGNAEEARVAMRELVQREADQMADLENEEAENE